MARALLRLSIAQLVDMSGADKMSIVRIEAGRRAQAATIRKLRAALETQGVVFIGAIEPLTEATVALRFGSKVPPASVDSSEDDATDLREPATDALRGYWANDERWKRLSPYGQKAITKVLDLGKF